MISISQQNALNGAYSEMQGKERKESNKNQTQNQCRLAMGFVSISWVKSSTVGGYPLKICSMHYGI